LEGLWHLLCSKLDILSVTDRHRRRTGLRACKSSAAHTTRSGLFTTRHCLTWRKVPWNQNILFCSTAFTITGQC